MTEAQQIHILRQILAERCYSTHYRPEFKRKGFTLMTDSDTAYRDIEYRNMPLYDTPEEAVDAIMEVFASIVDPTKPAAPPPLPLRDVEETV